MTKLLSEAFQKASVLPEQLQDQLAHQILEDLQGEARWDKTLADSQDQLDQIAEKAEHQYRSGKTKKAGFDEL